jgi:hypothetical protein
MNAARARLAGALVKKVKLLFPNIEASGALLSDAPSDHRIRSAF